MEENEYRQSEVYASSEEQNQNTVTAADAEEKQQEDDISAAEPEEKMQEDETPAAEPVIENGRYSSKETVPEQPVQPIYARVEQYSNPYAVANRNNNGTTYGNVKPAKVKKEHPVLKKFGISMISGVVFGLFAGLGIYIVISLSGSMRGAEQRESVSSRTEAVQPQEDAMEKEAMANDAMANDATANEATANDATESKPRDIEIEGTNEVTQIPQIETQTITAVVTDVTEVVKTAMPCVVSITNLYSGTDWYGESTQEEASGSGIIIGETDDELLIVTNYHVIEDCDELSITFIDDTEVLAYVKGSSPDNDLAVVTVFLEDITEDTANQIAIATLGDSDALQVGEPAIAIGNSLGYGQSVTTGVISALNREVIIDDISSYLIQTDAAINPGNSGGALLNVKGEVIGINSNKIANYVIEGMGYAIPISTAKPIIEELMQHETKRKVSDSERSFLGISGTDVTRDVAETYGMPKGVYIAQVLEDSAAQSAGLLKGDIITAFDGETITAMVQLQNILEYYAAGSTVEITIMRQNEGGYKEQTVTVTLGAKTE